MQIGNVVYGPSVTGPACTCWRDRQSCPAHPFYPYQNSTPYGGRVLGPAVIDLVLRPPAKRPPAMHPDEV